MAEHREEERVDVLGDDVVATVQQRSRARRPLECEAPTNRRAGRAHTVTQRITSPAWRMQTSSTFSSPLATWKSSCSRTSHPTAVPLARLDLRRRGRCISLCASTISLASSNELERTAGFLPGGPTG